MKRENFGSRLGFILVSAGCAIGLGNVWKFPYMAGQYGGAAFILIYLLFLVILGLPIIVCEFSVGRASQKSIATSYNVLEPKGTRWHFTRWFAIAGNYLLVMFYSMVGGWMLYYCFRMAKGEFAGIDSTVVSAKYDSMLESPVTLTFWTILVILLAFWICSIGLQKGVEKIMKITMLCLLAIMVVLAIRSVTLPGAAEGLRFYLIPDFGKVLENGVGNVIFGAMSQAFFTLSIGMGGMAIFGSYLDKSRSLTGESLSILLLDTCVALTAGLIVFPACFHLMYSRMQVPDLYLSLFRTFSLRCREDEFGGLCFSSSFSLQPCPRSSAYSKTLFPSGSIFLDSAAKNLSASTLYLLLY